MHRYSVHPTGKRNPNNKALNSYLDIRPKSEPTIKQMAGLHQVWRHITVYTVLTQEEIPEEGGLNKVLKFNILIFFVLFGLNTKKYFSFLRLGSKTEIA